MTESTEERDGGARLQYHVDFGRGELHGGALDLLDGFGETFDRYIVQQRARFDQTDTFGQSPAPLFAADGFG